MTASSETHAQPAVSIVVPVYGVPVALFRRCIESLLAQTLREREIIIIDDGTPDDLLRAACDDYAEDCIVRHTGNRGVSVARNLGTELARGTWVMYVDPDDWTQPTMCEELLAKARGAKSEPDIVFCDCVVEYGTHSVENPFMERGASFAWDERMRLRMLRQIMGRNRTYNPPEVAVGVPWAKLYRREFLKEQALRFEPELRRMQDNVFNLHAFQLAASVEYLDRSLMHYTKLGSSRSTRYSPRIVSDCEKVLDHTERFLERYGLHEELGQAYCRRVVQIVHSYLRFWLYHGSNPMTMRERRAKVDEIMNGGRYRTALAHLHLREAPFDVSVFAVLLRIRAHGLLGRLIAYRLRGREPIACAPMQTPSLPAYAAEVR